MFAWLPLPFYNYKVLLHQHRTDQIAEEAIQAVAGNQTGVAHFHEFGTEDFTDDNSQQNTDTVNGIIQQQASGKEDAHHLGAEDNLDDRTGDGPQRQRYS